MYVCIDIVQRTVMRGRGFSFILKGIALVTAMLLLGKALAGNGSDSGDDDPSGNNSNGGGIGIICGNGVVENGEECDDGNLHNRDG